MSVPLRWQEEFEPEPIRKPLRRRKAAHRRRSARALVVLAVGALVCGLTVIGVRHALLAQDFGGLRLLPASSTGGPLSLRAGSVERRLGYVSVVGSVCNHGTTALPKVEAIVELLDSNDQPIRMESSLIVFDPLHGGETSPFRVELQDDARATRYRVRFKGLLGSRLD